METTDAFTGLSCVDYGGILDPEYDDDRIDLTPAALAERSFESMWRYAELLPFAPVTLGEGETAAAESDDA